MLHLLLLGTAASNRLAEAEVHSATTHQVPVLQANDNYAISIYFIYIDIDMNLNISMTNFMLPVLIYFFLNNNLHNK